MVVFCLAALVFAVFALIQGLQYHRAIEQIEDNRDITIYSGSYELDVIQSSRRRRYVHYLFTLDNGDRLWVWKHNMANPEEIAAADEAGNPLPLTFRYGNLLIENDLISYQPFSIADTQGGQVFLSQESAAVSFCRDRAVAYFLSGLFLLCDLTFGCVFVFSAVRHIQNKGRARRRAARRAARKAARAKQFGTAD